MSGTIIRVSNFGDREQSLKDVRQVKKLRELHDALKAHVGARECGAVQKLCAAAELASEAAAELERAIKSAGLDRRERAPRALRSLVRNAEASADDLRRMALLLETSGLLDEEPGHA